MTKQNTACTNNNENPMDVLKRVAVKRISVLVSNDYSMGWAVRGSFLVAKTRRRATGPTQRPSQWVPWFFPQGVKRPAREADHSPPFEDLGLRMC